MKVISPLLQVLALVASSTTSAFIITNPSSNLLAARQSPAEARGLKQLLFIVPTAASCDGSSDQCATAADALGPIIRSFSQYKITTAPEQVALLCTMAFESGEFKFNRPISRNPGQGTRNMMNAQFILEYAAELGVAPATSNADAAVDILNSNIDHSFGSAAWFYDRKCTEDVKAAVRSGSQAGFELYVTSCLGTTVTAGDARMGYWQKAVTALTQM